MSNYVWQPTAQRVQQSHLFAFMQRHNIADLQALQARTTDDPAWFWDAMLREMGVVFETPYTDVMDDSGGIERPKWCVDGRMNITQSLLDRWLDSPLADKVAIVHESEDGTVQRLTYRQLHEQVSGLAGNLRQCGCGPGDVIAVMMPMAPPCVIAMLAIVRCGATFLPLFSGYGTSAVVSRLQDSGAKAIIFSSGFTRRGKVVSIASVVQDAIAQCPAVERVIEDKGVGPEIETKLPCDDFGDMIHGESGHAEIVGADDTCMLIYTSGTTGRPKGAAHTHCGFPVKAAADMLHGFDVHEDDVVFWMTDMGWMMGPWLVFGSLMLGATMVTYDGSPDVPDHGRIWQLCQDHRVTLLGVSPTLVRALMGRGDEHVTKHDLSSLRSFGSTGEPWNEGPWQWLFEVAGKRQLPILNYSGGTEISGGILCGNVLTPMKPCAFSGPMPGMDVDVVDGEGRSVRGEVGELVIRKPWIGMTRSFWNDDERYLDSYWRTFEGIWHHGDFAQVDEDGLWYIHGRSDDTIKVAGKRLGPAEAETVLVQHPRVAEAAALGVPDETKGQALVCLCVCDGSGDDELAAELRKLIADNLGKPLTPKAIVFVTELPKTRNGKVMRRVAKAAYLGSDAGDLSALENPSAVEAIRNSNA